MEKSVPDPPSENPANETSTEDPLRDRSALYRASNPHRPMKCASVTAYQCGDQLKGANRAMVDHAIECLGMKKN